jgi:hypothetical protein
METLERLVVHVEEAIRHAAMNDDPRLRLRLGLLLLDSAAELLLHRERGALCHRIAQALALFWPRIAVPGRAGCRNPSQDGLNVT